MKLDARLLPNRVGSRKEIRAWRMQASPPKNSKYAAVPMVAVVSPRRHDSSITGLKMLPTAIKPTTQKLADEQGISILVVTSRMATPQNTTMLVAACRFRLLQAERARAAHKIVHRANPPGNM